MNVMRLVLQKLWQGTSLTGDDVVALVLMLFMIASLSHLIIMLITRWGDRHIAVKSLLASLLVHAVCLLGLEVFEPLVPSTKISCLFAPLSSRRLAHGLGVTGLNGVSQRLVSWRASCMAFCCVIVSEGWI